MQARLEKYNHLKKQKRFYAISVQRSLFGEWCLLHEWGRIGARGSRKRIDYHLSLEEAQRAFATLKAQKLRRGYAPIPEQLWLLR